MKERTITLPRVSVGGEGGTTLLMLTLLVAWAHGEASDRRAFIVCNVSTVCSAGAVARESSL